MERGINCEQSKNTTKVKTYVENGVLFDALSKNEHDLNLQNSARLKETMIHMIKPLIELLEDLNRKFFSLHPMKMGIARDMIIKCENSPLIVSH